MRLWSTLKIFTYLDLLLLLLSFFNDYFVLVFFRLGKRKRKIVLCEKNSDFRTIILPNVWIEMFFPCLFLEINTQRFIEFFHWIIKKFINSMSGNKNKNVCLLNVWLIDVLLLFIWMREKCLNNIYSLVFFPTAAAKDKKGFFVTRFLLGYFFDLSFYRKLKKKIVESEAKAEKETIITIKRDFAKSKWKTEMNFFFPFF